jgi:hypothetical protein
MEDWAKLGIGFISTFVVGGLLYLLNRKSKKTDDHTAQFVTDLNYLIGLVAEAGRTIAAHQEGNLTKHKSFKKSREASADQRKQARQVQTRLCSLLAKELDKNEWELNHLTWVNATDSETGLIIDSEYRWTRDQVLALENRTTAYVTWLTNLRSHIIADASKKLTICR